VSALFASRAIGRVPTRPSTFGQVRGRPDDRSKGANQSNPAKRPRALDRDREIVGAAVAALGVPALRFHDLRSVAASAMVATGVDAKTAQRRLGHANVTLTLQVYARATAEADRRAAELIGERFRPRDRSPNSQKNRAPPTGFEPVPPP
jgi:integrase